MKIICIGKNYLNHIRELDRKQPSEPVFFMKPDSSIIIRNRPFFLPDFSEEIHYEAELIFRICKVGKCIQPKFAHTYYDAIGLGIDFTARDLSSAIREQTRCLPLSILVRNTSTPSLAAARRRFAWPNGATSKKCWTAAATALPRSSANGFAEAQHRLRRSPLGSRRWTITSCSCS